LNVLGTKPRGARLAFDAGDLIDQGKQLSNIMAVRSSQGNGQRDAMGVGEQMVLTSQFAPIRGIWAGFFTSARSPHRGTIHQSAIPIDLVGCLEFREKNFEKALPDTCLLPLPKVAQAGESGGKSARGGKTAPRNTGSQYKQNAGNDSSELTRLASRILNMAVLPGLGQQKFEAFPQVIGQDCLAHEKDSWGGLPHLPAAIMPNGRKTG
jgi:hypothetical protein